MDRSEQIGADTSEAGAIESLREIVDAARLQAPSLKELLARLLAVGPSVPPEILARYGPVVVWGQEFLFLLDSEQPATISIDEQPPVAMSPIAGTSFWYRLETLRLGTTHNFEAFSGDRMVGFVPRSVAGYNPGSYPIPGTARGTLSERRTVTSRIYGGATANYWIYANLGIDTVRGAPLMVWLDGQNCVGLLGILGLRMQTVTDNLVHRRQIPPMVHVLLSPATGGSKQPRDLLPGQSPEHAMRSLQLDTVSDEFGRHLLDEVLPDVENTVRLRQDGYSRGIAGESSGGIAAFKVCWFEPDAFSRAHSSIGSFTGLQWHPAQHLDGGFVFPFLIRREPRRNIRVWLSDGMNDFDVDSTVSLVGLYEAGSWPLANVQMAQALKTKFYDFHFRYGTAAHNSAQWALDLPESLAWLWRGYDPDKTGEVYEQEAAERAKPVYRVQIVNRDAW